jgi:hypothetical protein
VRSKRTISIDTGISKHQASRDVEERHVMLCGYNNNNMNIVSGASHLLSNPPILLYTFFAKNVLNNIIYCSIKLLLSVHSLPFPTIHRLS